MSTLAESLDDMRSDIGDFHGFGPDLSAFSDDQKRIVEKDLREGIRNVNKPTPFYAWTFLKPEATVTLASGESTVALDAEVRSLVGSHVFLGDSDDSSFCPVPVVSDKQVIKAFSQGQSDTGEPQMVSLRALRVMGEESNRKELYVYPTSDQAYTITFLYLLWPDHVDGAHPYPHGMPEHASLYRASCLAAAEMTRDNMPGSRAQEFQRQLSSSVQADRQRQGTMFGRMQYGSDKDYRPQRPSRTYPITIDGVVYD